MTLKEAINIILDGEAMLFVGSGYSHDAIKADGSSMNTASPLSQELIKQCGYEPDDHVYDLGQASEIFQEEKSEHELIDFLINEFTAIEVTSAQETIAILPWQRIYTTNYDNVVELANAKNKIHIYSPVLSESPNQSFGRVKHCVHLNGKVDKLTIDKLNGEFRLTNRSYLTQEFLESKWLSVFRTDLKSAKAIFFIGYSMKYDLDLQRIVFDSASIDKTFFIVHEKESDLNSRLLKKFGAVYPIGIDEFAKQVRDEQRNYKQVGHIAPPFLSFDQITIPKVAKNILDKDVFDFFYGGTFQREKLFFSLISPEDYPYGIYRYKLNDVMDKIQEGENRILVHSELGNGKTIFLNSIEYLLARNGYKVYHYKKYYSTIYREIESICQAHDKTAIIVDDYVGKLDVIDSLAKFHTDQVLIFSERTAVNEANYYKISDLFGDFCNIDINKLESEDITQLVELLNHYGLWHEMAAQSEEYKIRFINTKCDAKISRVVLKLLESPNIISKFQDIIDKIKNKGVYYDAIIFILVAHISRIEIDLDDVCNALDTSKLNSPSFKKDPIVNEFIDFGANEVKQKSALLSEFILRMIVDCATVVDVIIKIFKKLATQSHDKATRQILWKLMTFTNLQHVLNRKDENFSSCLLYLYETIGKIQFCRENPHYWLQYAIVMLSQYKYPQAKAYFQNAYAYAKKLPDFDTYQIDNHHARFILENEREYGTNDTCMEAFKEAHAILMDPKHKLDVRHYPYRVALNYYPFYEKFYKGMNKSEKKMFLNACDEMLDRITWYETSSDDVHRDVRRAKDTLILIKKEVQAQ